MITLARYRYTTGIRNYVKFICTDELVQRVAKKYKLSKRQLQINFAAACLEKQIAKWDIELDLNEITDVLANIVADNIKWQWSTCNVDFLAIGVDGKLMTRSDDVVKAWIEKEITNLYG